MFCVHGQSKIQLVTFTHLNSHADLALVTIAWHVQSAAAGLKLTEITKGKGKLWCCICWSVCRSLAWSRDEGGREEAQTVAVALCCNLKTLVCMI